MYSKYDVPPLRVTLTNFILTYVNRPDCSQVLLQSRDERAEHFTVPLLKK